MAESEQDLHQAATGEGFDPDQTWPDEPNDWDDDDLDDPEDHNDEPAEVE
jgi:hypothetical protein